MPGGPTNAYVEALNGLVKVLNRLGRGYSVEVLRAKVLLAHGAGKIAPAPKGKLLRDWHADIDVPAYRRRGPEPNKIGLVTRFREMAPPPQPDVHLGIDLSTLAWLIEEDAI